MSVERPEEIYDAMRTLRKGADDFDLAMALGRFWKAEDDAADRALLAKKWKMLLTWKVARQFESGDRTICKIQLFRPAEFDHITGGPVLVPFDLVWLRGK